MIVGDPLLVAISRQMDEAMEYWHRRCMAVMFGDCDFPQRERYIVETDPGDISGPRAPWDYGGAVADDDDCDC